MTLHTLQDLTLVELVADLREYGGVLYYHPKARPRLVVSSFLTESEQTEIRLALIVEYHRLIAANRWAVLAPFEIAAPMPRKIEREFRYTSSGGNPHILD